MQSICIDLIIQHWIGQQPHFLQLGLNGAMCAQYYGQMKQVIHRKAVCICHHLVTIFVIAVNCVTKFKIGRSRHLKISVPKTGLDMSLVQVSCPTIAELFHSV